MLISDNKTSLKLLQYTQGALYIYHMIHYFIMM